MIRALRITCLLLTLLVDSRASAGPCDGTSTVPALVTVRTAGPEQYIVRVVDQGRLDEMIDICTGTAPPQFVGIGLATGNAGYNRDTLNGNVWSWHAATVGLGNMCAEIYDGVPSFIEGNLEYWVETVGAFCPWTGQIVAIDPDSSIPGDFDIDGDVDADDGALLSVCLGDAGNPCYGLAQGCCAVDMDSDTDVDCVDWYLFRRGWTAPAEPPTPHFCTAAVPTVSTWGLAIMTLALLATGTLTIRTRQQTRIPPPGACTPPFASTRRTGHPPHDTLVISRP